MNEDFAIDDISVHLAASKNVTYQQRTIECFSVFIGFLQANGLTNRILLPTGEAPDRSLRIMRSDLTPVGFEVVKLGYHKWLKGIDRGKPIQDVKVLEKALAKVLGDK